MELTIQTASAAYPVILQEGAIQSISNVLPAQYDRLVVFADQHVWTLHGEEFKRQLDLEFSLHLVRAGESAKTLTHYEQSMTFLLENAVSRKSVLIAFGGGAIGDFAGFVAATYMRGIPFIQIPTTILAHDSAVGGKTGINHSLGKNMIGAFHQPLGVLYDPTFLKTLPDSEVRSGFSEVIKHAFLSDGTWSNHLQTITSINSLRKLDWQAELAKGIQVKAKIVEQDEKEASVRKYLNLGHTYGHALEALAGFGRLKHGEAVAIGLVVTFYLSGLEQLATNWFKQLSKLGYPLEAVTQFSIEEIITYIRKDKKNSGEDIQFVLLHEIGKPYVSTVHEEVIRLAHDRLVNLVKEERT